MTRGQPVRVKVLSISAGKMSLSMKEVDQETGEDLNPGAMNKSAAGFSNRDDDMEFKNPGERSLAEKPVLLTVSNVPSANSPLSP